MSGGRWRPAVALVLCCLSVPLIALNEASSNRTVAAAPPTHIEAGGVCLTSLTPQKLDTLFDTEPGGVVGADYQRALAMPDGRVLWTFQDAAVRIGLDEIVIVHNIAVLQDGLCFTVLYGGSRSNPQPMFFASRTVPYERWFWPMDASVGDDGRIYVFTAELEERSADYLTHTVPVGTWVAVFDPVTDQVTGELRPVNASADLYGWSITSDDSWTYLYANCYRQFGFDLYLGIAAFDRACSPRITVARVPLGRLLDPPAYWDGSSWQSDPGRAVPVIDTLGRRINADQIEWTGARFVSVNKEGDWWGDSILLSRSNAPTGPFEVYDTVAAPVKCGECNSFFANWVPAQAVGRTDRSFVISLAHNRWDGRITSLYRPTFHQVVAPRFLPAGESFSFDVGAEVEAVMLNVVAVEPRAAGYVTLYPCDRGVPKTSNLNYVNEPLISNLVIARPDDDGRVCVLSKATTDVVVDLAGTFVGSSFTPVESPVRLTDTRELPGAARIAAGGVLRVELPAGLGPASAAVNVIALDPLAPGYLTVYPCDQDRPATSNINYVTEPIVSNLVVTATDDAGAFCIYTLADTHVVVDLAGVFPEAAGGFDVVDAVRLADTREGDPTTRLKAGSTLTVDVTATGSAVALNVIAVSPGAAGYLTVYPCDIARPGTSNLNYATAPIVANLVVTRPSTDGKVCVYSSAATDVVVDVTGTTTATSGFDAVDVPLRLVDSRTGVGIGGQLGTPVETGIR